MEQYGSQIRAAHLALAALSLGLLVLLLERVPSQADEAIVEAKLVRSLLLSWDPKFLDAYAADQLRLRQFADVYKPPKPVKFKHPDKSEFFQLTFSSPIWSLQPLPPEIAKFESSYEDTKDEFSDHWQLQKPFLRGRTLLKKPESLQQFFDTWNALNSKIELRKAIDIAPQAYFHSVFDSSGGQWVSVAPFISDAKVNDQGNARVISMLFRAPTSYEKTFFNQFDLFKANSYSHFFTGGLSVTATEQWEIELPALTTAVLSFNGQGALLDSAKGEKRILGTADQSFSALAKESSDFREVSLDTAIKILEVVSKKPSEQFEVFGVKIPTGKAIGYGVPLLLAIQLYMLANIHALKQLSSPLDRKLIESWVGFYNSHIAQALSNTTAVLAPVAITAMVLTQEANFRRTYWSWVLATAGTAATLLISIVTFCAIKAVRARLQPSEAVHAGQSDG